MSEYAAGLQRQGARIGLVPTMGFLHQGHLSLVDLLKEACDVRMVSIFVNPIQFRPIEDYERYPRDDKRDLELLEARGCDLAFIPTAGQMYPQGFETRVKVGSLALPLCGAFRPGHFEGVATVVLKLFSITRSNAAAFGLKDCQQALVIKRMVEDFNLGVQLLFGETLRDSDGLALSSRNAYLSADARRDATAIPQALEWARMRVAKGERNCVKLKNGMRKIIESKPLCRIQYLESVDPETLESQDRIGDRVLVALAVHLGSVRLIDNALLRSNIGSEVIK